MSHGDYLAQVPDGFQLVAHTDACPTAAIADESRGFYGVQFHPEVNHTVHGQEMLRNFLYAVCQCDHTWTMRNYMKTAIADVREKVGTARSCWRCPAVSTAPSRPRCSPRPSAIG